LVGVDVSTGELAGATIQEQNVRRSPTARPFCGILVKSGLGAEH
jgi:hypothetical protein